MPEDKGGIVRIEDCIIFYKLNKSYLLSLGYFRTLIMLDQCHDFCETGARNKWVNDKTFTKDEIIDSEVDSIKEVATSGRASLKTLLWIGGLTAGIISLIAMLIPIFPR